MAWHARENKEHFAPWDPVRTDAYFTEPYWEKELALGVESARQGVSLPLMMLHRDAPAGPVVGRCNFSNIVRGAFQAAHLGYGLDRGAVGQGLMHEALAAAIAYCFEEMKLHRIMANYMPTNERSARLLRKLGFVPEGFARDYLFLGGTWRDHVLTSLTSPNWKSE